MGHLRDIKQQTRALLVGMGTSPDSVARSLRAAGAVGVPKSNRSCPVALYLRASMGADPRIRSVAVGHCSLVIEINSPRDLRPAGRLDVQLPKPVRQFVAAFDEGRFPDVARPSNVSVDGQPTLVSAPP